MTKFIVDSVPRNITVSAAEGDLYNIDIHAGEVKKVCSASGKELIRLEGLEDFNIIGLTLVSEELIKLLNCMKNSGEGGCRFSEGIIRMYCRPAEVRFGYYSWRY